MRSIKLLRFARKFYKIIVRGERLHNYNNELYLKKLKDREFTCELLGYPSIYYKYLDSIALTSKGSNIMHKYWYMNNPIHYIKVLWRLS